MGTDWAPIPCISVLAAPAGVRVPARGEAIKGDDIGGIKAVNGLIFHQIE
jgi:hypothetical protein